MTYDVYKIVKIGPYATVYGIQFRPTSAGGDYKMQVARFNVKNAADTDFADAVNALIVGGADYMYVDAI